MVVKIDKKKCISCAGCVAVCPVQALELKDKYPVCDEKCINCLSCIKFCPVAAINLVKGR
ncbi:MAG: 4Fe-4S binding protein [Candidatus Aenigmarchaeota archaeon]|nr:4Fe-4S binding protein [Candidatus Aenigmarchaeota archaeon]